MLKKEINGQLSSVTETLSCVAEMYQKVVSEDIRFLVQSH